MKGLEKEVLEEYLSYKKSDEARRDSRLNLINQVIDYLKSKYPNSNIELGDDTQDEIIIKITGTDEEKTSILAELKDLGLVT